MIHVDFNLTTIHAGVFNYKYRGIPCLKCPFDFALYQMIIFKCKPDLIIEIGTRNGGSALYLSDLQKLCGIDGQVHTIDLPGNKHQTTYNQKGIRYFNEGFDGYDLSNTKGFERVMVIDDGSHYPWDIERAFKKFNEFVTPRQYYIIEDGIISYWGWTDFQGGPINAIEGVFEHSPMSDFRIDWQMCNFFGHNATFNPHGYLIKL